jgi:stage II sporulation protein AA (anti-sigma F factor antagonist)
MQEASAATPVLAPTGALDLATSRSLGSELGELAGTPGDAVLDLSEVGFIDSMGLGVVLKAVNRFNRQGKALHLVVPPDGNVARLLELTGTTGRVSASETREQALARAGAPR